MSYAKKNFIMLVAAIACLSLVPFVRYVDHPNLSPPKTELVWPVGFDTESEHGELYQPAIEQWTDKRIQAHAAVAMNAKNEAPTYGDVRFSARTQSDKKSGNVHLSQIAIEGVDVPTDPNAASRIRSALQRRIPPAGLTLSQDELLAQQRIAQSEHVPTQNAVPQILFASSPTLLVLVDGDPAWRKIGSSGIERAINARAMLLRDSNGAFYLHAAGYWYRSDTAGSSWAQSAHTPQPVIEAAIETATTTAADPMLPSDGVTPARAPAVLMTTQPAELIVTNGAPQFVALEGTKLLTLANADHAVFLDPVTHTNYLLLSGRWFSAPQLSGPWQYVPGSELPPDFAKIAQQDSQADVLAAVPGTSQARASAIAATIPKTATVSRSKATLTVHYDGKPAFAPIAGTSLQYAVNSATPIIRTAGGSYYAVSNGIWFVSPTPTGMWTVAISVPAAIYTIPPGSPLYYVTFVRIYKVTPDVVVMGYTPGYLGVVVSADGTVVYGTGYVYTPYVGAVYYGYPVTYGYGASVAWSAVEGFAFGFAAGAIWGAAAPYWSPYWHYGPYYWNYANISHANFYGRWGEASVTHAAGWNPWTGTSWAASRGYGFDPHTGARYYGGRAGAYNPYSGDYAAGRRGAFYNPSTGMSGVARGGITGNRYSGDYTAGRQVAGYSARTGRAGVAEFDISGNIHNGDFSTNSKGIVVNRRTNSGVAWDNGKIVVDHDGHIHTHTPGGSTAPALSEQRKTASASLQRLGQSAQRSPAHTAVASSDQRRATASASLTQLSHNQLSHDQLNHNPPRATNTDNVQRLAGSTQHQPVRTSFDSRPAPQAFHGWRR